MFLIVLFVCFLFHEGSDRKMLITNLPGRLAVSCSLKHIVFMSNVFLFLIKHFK